MFGTFEKERDTKIHYGLVHNIKSFNPVWVQVMNNPRIAYKRILLVISENFSCGGSH